MRSQPIPRKPIRVYRLWCGRRRYSGWKASRLEAMKAGVRPKVTFADAKGIALGPLAWLEVGERKYARSRTVSLGAE